MAYYEDLTPWVEPGTEANGQLLAVGWLEKGRPYTQGGVDEEFFRKLVSLLVDPWQPFCAVGVHDCGLCRYSGGPHCLTYQGMTIQMGLTNLFVPAGGSLYIAPSLIAHYIDAHEYAPPAPFRHAVLNCPPMQSMEYRKAILRSGAGRLLREPNPPHPG